MSNSNLAKAEQELQALSALEVEIPKAIPFSFFNRPENKTTKLISVAPDQSPMTGRNIWYNFEFNELVFITSIKVEVSGYSSTNDFRFSWKTPQGETKETVLSPLNENFIIAEINSILTSFSFKPDRKIFESPEITKVTVSGFPATSTEKYLKWIGQAGLFKEEVEKHCATVINDAREKDEKNIKLTELINTNTKKAEELFAESKEIETRIGKLKAEQTATQSDIDGRRHQLSNLEKQIADSDDLKRTKRLEIESLEDSRINLQNELNELKSDINLFPVEIKEFVAQGANNIKVYWLYSVIPLLILIIVTLHLLHNATNLLAQPTLISFSSVFATLVTRLPYIILMTAIIVASYKIAHFMLSEVIRINRQRLNLTKIGIIAKDVIESSVVGTVDLTDDEIVTARTKLKMEMLRDHLKNYLSEDFYSDSKATTFENIISGLRKKTKSSKPPESSDEVVG